MLNERNAIRGHYPIAVEKIVFTDGSTLENADVFIMNDFIIVGAPDGGAPSMFNIREISELRRVKEIRPQNKVTGITW